MSLIQCLSSSYNLPKILDTNIQCYVDSKDWLSDKQFTINVNKDKSVNYSCGDSLDQSVKELCGQNIDEFFCGSEFLFAKNYNNQVFGWDWTGKHLGLLLNENNENSIQKLDFFDNKNIAEICCGFDHCLALSFDGLAYGWGCNRSGQFGSGIQTDWIREPVYLNDIYCKDSKIKYIYCKQNNSFFITTDGKVYVFGKDFETNPLILKVNGAKKLCYSSGSGMSSKCAVLSESGQLFIHNVSKYPTEVMRKETNVMDIHDIPWDDSTILAEFEDCLYLLNDNHGKIEKNKTDYINYFDYMLNKFNCTVKTVHVSEEGYLFTNCLKLSDTYKRNTNQNLLVFEEKNVFNRKFENKFEDLGEIEGGKPGTIMHKVKCLKTDKEFAIKCIEMNENINLNEIKMLFKVKCKYVVELHDSWVECRSITKKNITKYLFIQMDLCSQNLREFLEDSNQMIKDDFTIFNYYIWCLMFEELTECLNYLHGLQPPIIHRDIKPENILISNGTDDTFFKLCDFEFAKIHEKSSHTRGVGTQFYAAPEVLDGRQYNVKSDVYSLALIATEIFNFDECVDKIRDKNNVNEYLNKFRKPVGDEKIDSLKDLLNKCLFTEDYHLRPSCQQIINQIQKINVNENDLQINERYLQFTNKIRGLGDCPFKAFCNRILKIY